MALNREQFLAKTKKKFIEFEGVRLQSLTELERSNLEASWVSRDADDKSWLATIKRSLIIACAVDEDGNKLFSEDDMKLLGEADGAFIGRLYEKCRILCGFDEGDVEAFAAASSPTDD